METMSVLTCLTLKTPWLWSPMATTMSTGTLSDMILNGSSLDNHLNTLSEVFSVTLRLNSGINQLMDTGWPLLSFTRLTLTSKTSSSPDSGTNFLNTLIALVETEELIKVSNVMMEP
jgi:hypothetical protein